MDIIELKNDLTPGEYLKLIEAINWKSLNEEQVHRAINNSMYVVKAVVCGETIGMGRLVGDFSIHGMLTDIIIHPKYQGQGIGKMIVLDIKKYVTDYIKEGERFLIELCPTSGKRKFYTDCGFKYKPENMDGMYLWIEK